jgi:hypothetical protein
MLLGSFVAGVAATTRTTPPSGSLTVCSSGCDYKTVGFVDFVDFVDSC